MTESLKISSLKSAVTSLESGWNAFESRLLLAAGQPGFSDYLKNYRGISESEVNEHSRNLVSSIVTDAVRLWLEEAVLSGWNSDLHSGPVEFADYLSACESAVNIALYFWHAPHERNLQFRTFVHFASIPSEPILLSRGGGVEFFIRLTEWGVQLSITDSFEPFPRRISLAKACNLSSLSWGGKSKETDVSGVIADLRVIQREFCQLVDEWEHCNSILAVRQFGLRKLAASEQAQAQQIFSEISRTRDLLAQWCASSAADLQAAISGGLLLPELHPDARAELATTDALLLSGFQKFYLPASVSRHVYGSEVVEEFRRFAKERLQGEPEDMCSLISNAAFSLALGVQPRWQEILSALEKKSFYWSLSADPSAALKSVAWAYSPAEHQLLTALLILTLDAKREPERLEVYWLQAIASVVEMPSTFNRARPEKNDFLVDSRIQAQLCQRAIRCFDHFSADENDENKNAFQYIVEFLKSDLRSPQGE